MLRANAEHCEHAAGLLFEYHLGGERMLSRVRLIMLNLSPVCNITQARVASFVRAVSSERVCAHYPALRQLKPATP